MGNLCSCSDYEDEREIARSPQRTYPSAPPWAQNNHPNSQHNVPVCTQQPPAKQVLSRSSTITTVTGSSQTTQSPQHLWEGNGSVILVPNLHKPPAPHRPPTQLANRNPKESTVTNPAQRSKSPPRPAGKENVVISQKTSQHKHSANALRPRAKSAVRVPDVGKGCSACGDPEHLTESCRYATRLCFHCREEGHISRVCPKRQKGKRDNSNTRQARSRSQPRK